MQNLTDRELTLFTLFVNEEPNSPFTDAVQSASDEGASEFGALTSNLVRKGLLRIEEDESRRGESYFYLTDAGRELAEVSA
jgi:hypothetical protein